MLSKKGCGKVSHQQKSGLEDARRDPRTWRNWL